MLLKKTKGGTLTKPATAHQVHRTVRAALNEAVRRGYVAKNPATLAKTPRGRGRGRADHRRRDPAPLRTATQTRNGARWAIALALGLRQGEALGLKWSDVAFESQTLAIRRGRLRPQYEHGCAGRCDRKYAGHCPQRIQTRPETDSTKSRAERRYVGLPDSLCDLLKEHRAKQNEERLHAGSEWLGGDWVFATKTGAPLNPRSDWGQWKKLLKDADIRDSRLHDARHTAATVLLLLGVTCWTPVSPSSARGAAPVNIRLAPRPDQVEPGVKNADP